jgi:hypothetical protein
MPPFPQDISSPTTHKCPTFHAKQKKKKKDKIIIKTSHKETYVVELRFHDIIE